MPEVKSNLKHVDLDLDDDYVYDISMKKGEFFNLLDSVQCVSPTFKNLKITK